MVGTRSANSNYYTAGEIGNPRVIVKKSNDPTCYYQGEGQYALLPIATIDLDFVSPSSASTCYTIDDIVTEPGTSTYQILRGPAPSSPTVTGTIISLTNPGASRTPYNLLKTYSTSDTTHDGPQLNANEFLKIHLQLGHGIFSEIETYVRSAIMWHPAMKNSINEVLQRCECILGSDPQPHSKIAARPPTIHPMKHISIDAVKFEGKNFLH